MPSDEMSVGLRDYIERLDLEQDRRLDERFQAQNEAISKAEQNLQEVLTGFPQEYAKVTVVEEMRRTIEAIQRDHVQRREVEDLKNALIKLGDDFKDDLISVASDARKATADVSDEVKTTTATATGRRSVLLVLTTAAISVTLVTAGYFITDRQNLNEKIQLLQERDHQAETTIAKIQQQLIDIMREVDKP